MHFGQVTTRNETRFLGVFEVYHAVTDVVGGFHQVHEGVAGKAALLLTGQAQVLPHLLSKGRIGLHVVEFFSGAVGFDHRMTAALRVFKQCAVTGKGEPTPPVPQPRHNPKALGVAFKAGHILKLGLAKVGAQAGRVPPRPLLNRGFARMTKGRVADVVREASHADHRAHII